MHVSMIIHLEAMPFYAHVEHGWICIVARSLSAVEYDKYKASFFASTLLNRKPDGYTHRHSTYPVYVSELRLKAASCPVQPASSPPILEMGASIATGVQTKETPLMPSTARNSSP